MDRIKGDQAPHSSYGSLLPRASIPFLYSKTFADALLGVVLAVCESYNIEREEALEEFRRFIALKVYYKDKDSTFLSATPLSTIYSLLRGETHD